MVEEEAIVFIESEEMLEFLRQYGENNPDTIKMSEWCNVIGRVDMFSQFIHIVNEINSFCMHEILLKSAKKQGDNHAEK